MTHFPDALSAVAKVWRRSVAESYKWRKTQNPKIKAGGSGGFEVEADGFPYRGYLKPTTICTDAHPKAANEKIAADLAYELDVPVPPAILYLRDDAPVNPAGAPTEERRACVSLIVYNEQYEWGTIMQLAGLEPLTREIIKSAMARCSGAIVLDLLLGQTDRNNARNVIFGIDRDEPSKASFVFLDFANSANMGNRWSGDGWKPVADPGFPAIMTEALDKGILQATVERLMQLPHETVHEIIGRIDKQFLTDTHKDVLTTAITGRRQLVTDFVRQRFLS